MIDPRTQKLSVLFDELIKAQNEFDHAMEELAKDREVPPGYGCISNLNKCKKDVTDFINKYI